MNEIERKFLVSSEAFKLEASEKKTIKQGYLNSNPERTVRIRISGEKAFMTVKGISNESGTTRFEWEKEILKEDAQDLLKLCEPGSIEKTRYLVKQEDHTFEVDEFYGNNKGLVIAEIELRHENESFEKPRWLGEEVTGDKKYYNSYLAKKPYQSW